MQKSLNRTLDNSWGYTLKITPKIRLLFDTARFHYISDNSCVLTFKPLTNDEYDSIKYIVESANGHWREKLKGFQFDYSIQDVNNRLVDILNRQSIIISEVQKFQIENQFYPTPEYIAFKMCCDANISSHHTVLEPSAGKGDLLRQIQKFSTNYTAVESNRENAEYLKRTFNNVYNMTFENYYRRIFYKTRFDRIVMNPPFANALDIKHIMMAFELLKDDGKLIGLMAENSIYYDRPITKVFNQFLNDTNAHVSQIPHGSFRDSGTLVDIIQIEIDKKYCYRLNMNYKNYIKVEVRK